MTIFKSPPLGRLQDEVGLTFKAAKQVKAIWTMTDIHYLQALLETNGMGALEVAHSKWREEKNLNTTLLESKVFLLNTIFKNPLSFTVSGGKGLIIKDNRRLIIGGELKTIENY